MEKEQVLPKENQTLEEIIQGIADEEGMTFDETMALFKQGLKNVNGINKVSNKTKAKTKARRKLAKASRRKNRK